MRWHCSSATELILVFVALAAYGMQLVTAEGHTLVEEGIIESSCEQSECLRCDLPTGRCLKCRFAMMDPSRECLDRCPAGHAATWRQDTQYQGTVCSPGSLLSAITGRDIAVIACAAAGGAVCVGIILGAIIYARRNAVLKPMPEDGGSSRKIPVPRVWRDPRPSAADTAVGVEERKEFLRGLSGLRKDTALLLEILAETRMRFRGMGGPDHNMDSKARAYKAVVRDLSRVVSLIARRDDSFHAVPADWRKLFAWAERLLQRYKRTRDNKCCPGCEHHKQSTTGKSSASPDGAGLSPQPMFLTRQKAQDERWRKQREDASKGVIDKPSPDGGSNNALSSEYATFAIPNGYSNLHPCTNLEPAILEETLEEESEDEQSEKPYFCKVEPHDIEISYTQDEEALAYQRAQYTIINENMKNDMKTNNVNLDSAATNKSKRDKGSPSMISRIFCNRLLNSNDLNSDLNDLQKEKITNNVNILHEEECLSSTSIYDHIEAFTFDDFSAPTKPEVKPNISKQKSANVNINRLRKPNFPGYSESFKQILDKKNLLNIQRTKIQKRLSRKGEQLNKMVRRTESRFLKDRSKLDPNMTYDRRNCKNDVVNEQMVGGDVYVSVVKQPVVEREQSEHSGAYQNFNDLESVPDKCDNIDSDVRKIRPDAVRLQVPAASITVINCQAVTNTVDREIVSSNIPTNRGNDSNVVVVSSNAQDDDDSTSPVDKNLRCEILTVV